MENKRGFIGFVIKAAILWAVIIGICVMTIVSPNKNEGESNTLQMLGISFGFGIIITLVMVFSSRCPKCGKFLAMGPTQKERTVLAVNTKTTANVKRGLLTGAPKLDVNSKSKEVYGTKKTKFCTICGYTRVREGK
jgi:hypothetical protein